MRTSASICNCPECITDRAHEQAKAQGWAFEKYGVRRSPETRLAIAAKLSANHRRNVPVTLAAKA